MNTTIKPIFDRLISEREAEAIKIMLRLDRPATIDEILPHLKEPTYYQKLYKLFKKMQKDLGLVTRERKVLQTAKCWKPFILWSLAPEAKEEFRSLLENEVT